MISHSNQSGVVPKLAQELNEVRELSQCQYHQRLCACGRTATRVPSILYTQSSNLNRTTAWDYQYGCTSKTGILLARKKGGWMALIQ